MAQSTPSAESNTLTVAFWNIQWFPGHMNVARKEAAKTMEVTDVIVEVLDARIPNAPYPMKGVGPFTHEDPRDRPPEIFGGRNTLHFGPGRAPYVLLPVIPA